MKGLVIQAMPKTNPLIMKGVEAEIKRMILRGELLLPDVVEENLNDNLDCQRMMMTIAVNRGLGIGKRRFEEKVNPELWKLEEEYRENKRTVDQEYAVACIEREFKRIMGEDSDAAAE